MSNSIIDKLPVSLDTLPETYKKRTMTRNVPVETRNGTFYRSSFFHVSQNSKLAISVPYSTLPVGLTCPCLCNGCYALAMEKRYPAFRYHAILSLASIIYEREKTLKECNFLLSNIKRARVNIGGDIPFELLPFFMELFDGNKETDFLVYTKFLLTYQALKEVKNCFIHYSNGVNYGTLEYINTLAKEKDGFLCYYSLNRNNVCGGKCVLCWKNKSPVYFIEHKTGKKGVRNI